MFSKIIVQFYLIAAAVLQIANAQAPLERIDCHPEPNAKETVCNQRGCVWSPGDFTNGAPWCYTPLTYGYQMVGEPVQTPIGYYIYLRRSVNGSYYGNDFEALTLEIQFQSDYRVRFKISPTNIPRFEVPLKINPATGGIRDPLYEIEYRNSPVFSFQVLRARTGTILFDTSMGGLTFSEQFIQISTRLPTTNVYGIGENEQSTFKQNFTEYNSLPLYARDNSPEGDVNIYGVHPYYTVVDHADGDTHSVLFLNSNAQEFVQMPAPGFVYRTIGGLLDIYIFLGPTPEDTVEQFTEAVGYSPIPPYWGLGFQLCRWGYDNIQNMKAAVDRTAEFGIPHDVQYGDIDIMERSLDFTLSDSNFPGLAEYVKELKTRGIKFITILDPGISFKEPAGTYRPFDLGNEMDVWIKRPDGTPVVGEVWPGQVYFPDYSRPSAREWWIILIKEFKNLIDYDGLWIDMNEPASWGVGDEEQGCSTNTINSPPYVPGIKTRNLADSTICPDAQQDFGLHYNTHSLYGWSESEPTQTAVRQALGKRGVVLTRSSFIGNGKWASHWLGDNFSRWSNLHASIIGMLQFNQFGIPYVGADICGFGEAATLEMCQRWQQLGAFYTFSRNHNALGNRDQDPGNFGPEFADSTRKALLVRYTLLPYLYTLFYEHSVVGRTVVRALWHEFPSDQTALTIDKQFLWGKGLLVSPVLDEGATSVIAYFPNARWFNYYNGSELPTSSRGTFVELDAPLDFINVHLQGGIIYPTQEPAINTELSRNNPFGLIVALNDDGLAKGRLYVDDGDSIDPVQNEKYFEVLYETYDTNTLVSLVTNNGYDVSSKTLDTIRLLGAGNVGRILVNYVVHTDFTIEPSGEVRITKLNLPLGRSLMVIQWLNVESSKYKKIISGAIQPFDKEFDRRRRKN